MPYNDINEEFIDRGWEQMKVLLDKEMPLTAAMPFWKNWRILIVLFLLPGLLALDTEKVYRSSFADPSVANASPQQNNLTIAQSSDTEKMTSISAIIPAEVLSNDLLGTDTGQEREPESTGPGPAIQDQLLASVGGEKRGSERELISAQTTNQVLPPFTGEQPVKRSTQLYELLDRRFILPELNVGIQAANPTGPSIVLQKPRRWSWGIATGAGVALAHPQFTGWFGVEGEYLLHSKWSLWTRMGYQWNRLGSGALEQGPIISVEDSMDPSSPTITRYTLLQSDEDLAVHRVGLLLGGAFRPHPAIRLEGGFQLNYFSPYALANDDAFVPSSTPSAPTFNPSVEFQELSFKTWEPVIQTGLYWRMSPEFQLGAVWQQTLVDMSQTDGYSLQPSHLSLGLRWQFR